MASLQAVKTIIRALLARPTSLGLMLWGPPGIGKTSIVSEAAREAGVGIKSVIAHLYQPVDVLGLPYLVKGRCEYAPPAVFPDPKRDGERGIFFIDELPGCVPAMQSAWGIIILERSTRHFTFPSGWQVICAGNRETDRAGASRLISALESRLLHIEVEPSTDEFLQYGLSRRLHPAVLAFLEERRDLLLAFDPRSRERSFPCPRAWERVSEALSLSLPDEITREMVRGLVGSGAATEFLAFLRVHRELPTLAEVLSGEVELTRWEKRPDVLRAVLYSVLHYVSESTEEARFAEAARVALNTPDEWAVLLLKRLYQLDPAKLLGTPSWPQLAARFGKYLA